MTPFDFVNSINDKILINPNDKEYLPFVINRAFSFQKDAIFHANEMNMASCLSKQQQYDFYYYSLPKRKRWGKWKKQLSSDDIINIRKYYKVPYRKAIELINVLTKKQLKEIAAILEEGG